MCEDEDRFLSDLFSRIPSEKHKHNGYGSFLFKPLIVCFNYVSICTLTTFFHQDFSIYSLSRIFQSFIKRNQFLHFSLFCINVFIHSSALILTNTISAVGPVLSALPTPILQEASATGNSDKRSHNADIPRILASDDAEVSIQLSKPLGWLD